MARLFGAALFLILLLAALAGRHPVGMVLWGTLLYWAAAPFFTGGASGPRDSCACL
jgi:hypothetical protein